MVNYAEYLKQENHMIELYCDGACLHNPGGAGAYAFVIVENGRAYIQEKKGYRSTTNNRMELMSCIEGLKKCDQLLKHKGTKIFVLSDSKYVVKGAESWVWRWSRNGWRTKKGNVLNRDLWEELLGLLGKLQNVRFKHVPGHSGYRWNELCDELAGIAAIGTNLEIDLNYESQCAQIKAETFFGSELDRQFEMAVELDI